MKFHRHATLLGRRKPLEGELRSYALAGVFIGGLSRIGESGFEENDGKSSPDHEIGAVGIR